MSRWWSACAAVVLACAAQPTSAQEFGVYLDCGGTITSGGKNKAAKLNLALRRNSQLALVSSSDVLPDGARLKLDMTPRFYTMTLVVPTQSAAWYNWFHGHIVVWSPYLKNLHAIRMSVDRQSAVLEGELRDGAGDIIGRIAMRCTPGNNDTVPEPKF